MIAFLTGINSNLGLGGVSFWDQSLANFTYELRFRSSPRNAKETGYLYRKIFK
jgi:hypothetical protein